MEAINPEVNTTADHQKQILAFLIDSLVHYQNIQRGLDKFGNPPFYEDFPKLFAEIMHTDAEYVNTSIAMCGGALPASFVDNSDGEHMKGAFLGCGGIDISGSGRWMMYFKNEKYHGIYVPVGNEELRSSLEAQQ
jgi:hypothetical protein